VYNKVYEYNLGSFDFRYLKIDFPNYKDDSTANNTEIKEINFSRLASSILLVNPKNTDKINIY